MQITSQSTDNKKLSEYRVTEADVMFFSNLLGIWEGITKGLVSDHSKLATEYAKQLSQLTTGDKIIVSCGAMGLDLLCKLTTYYGVNVLCLSQTRSLESLKLEEFETLLTSVREDESIKGYAEYLQQKKSTLEESKNI
jgi:hypothetical protein